MGLGDGVGRDEMYDNPHSFVRSHLKLNQW